MKSEQLAYAFKPAGHSPPPEKREHKEPDRKLAQAFEKWLKELPKELDCYESEVIGESYANAYKRIAALKPSEFSTTTAQAVLVQYKGHPNIEKAGLFISAIYNQLPHKEIVFEMEEDIYWLGFRLSARKVLINRGKVGYWMGSHALGDIINFGETGAQMGADATGLIANYGKTGDGLGDGAGTFINEETNGEGEIAPSVTVSRKGMVVNYGETGEIMGSTAHVSVINCGKSGSGLGNGASSVIINFGETGREMGYASNSNSFIVNCGKAGRQMGKGTEGVVIAMCKPQNYAPLRIARHVLQPEDCEKLPRLRTYLKNLKAKLEAGRADYRTLLSMRSLRGIRIEDKLNRLLEKSGVYI